MGSAVGYAMDGFDLLILGFMLSAISKDLNLTPGQAGSLVTWTLIGAVFGGIVFGALSDRYGRIRVLTWTIVLFAVFTGLCAFAQGYWDLLAYRTIAGIGLGGEKSRLCAWPFAQVHAAMTKMGFKCPSCSYNGGVSAILDGCSTACASTAHQCATA